MFKLVKYKNNNLLDLFKWRNDSIYRKYSFNKKKINLKEHLLWIKNTLKNKKNKIYIFYLKNEPIGSCSIIAKKNFFILSYSIKKKFRGRGLSKIMMKLLNKKLVYFKKKNIVYADVLKINRLSLATLIKNGFVIKKKYRKFLRLKLN